MQQDIYDALQAELENIPKQHLTIIMGDFNAKVESNRTGYKRIMGRYGCGIMNENGEKFAEFCGNNKLFSA